MADEFDEETLAFAHRMFDLARSGKAAELSEYVDAGLPVNMTNDKGDTLLILASYHLHSDAVLHSVLPHMHLLVGAHGGKRRTIDGQDDVAERDGRKAEWRGQARDPPAQ